MAVVIFLHFPSVFADPNGHDYSIFIDYRWEDSYSLYVYLRARHHRNGRRGHTGLVTNTAWTWRPNFGPQRRPCLSRPERGWWTTPHGSCWPTYYVSLYALFYS